METTHRLPLGLALCALIPLIFWLVDRTIPSGTLIQLGLAAWLYFLAAQGVRSIFPQNPDVNRTMGTMAWQYALLGLTFSAGMTLFFSLVNQKLNALGAPLLLILFAAQALAFGGLTMLFEFLRQRWRSAVPRR